MKKLIVLVIVFSYVAFLGTRVTGGLQQLSKYGGEPLDVHAAFLTGGLEFEGLDYLSEGKKTSGGLYVVHNSNEQVTANVNVLEPKVSDAYLQYGHTPMVGVYSPQAAGENQTDSID